MNALRRPVTLASRSLIQRRYASAEARRVEPAGTEARQEGKNLASAARRDPELFVSHSANHWRLTDLVSLSG